MRVRRERTFLWGISPSSRLWDVWFIEYLLINDFLFPFPFHILQISFVCLIDWCSLICQVEGGARVTDCSITTSRSYSRKFILTKDRRSSSFLNPSTSSRYVSQVSFSSFIFCTCIAHHSIILKPSFRRSMICSLRRAIKLKTHFWFNVKPLDLNFRLNQTPFAHPKHWPATREKRPPWGKWVFPRTTNWVLLVSIPFA